MSFSETQRIKLGIRLVFLAGIIPAAFIVARAYNQQPTSENLYVLLSILFFPVLLYFLLLNNHAKTRIDSLGIHYQYWPFVAQWRTISWGELQSVSIKRISPITDFGGWGYKFGRKKRGIILSGDKAIFITLNNNKVFAITTNEPERARKAIEKWAQEKLV